MQVSLDALKLKVPLVVMVYPVRLLGQRLLMLAAAAAGSKMALVRQVLVALVAVALVVEIRVQQAQMASVAAVAAVAVAMANTTAALVAMG